MPNCVSSFVSINKQDARKLFAQTVSGWVFGWVAFGLVSLLTRPAKTTVFSGLRPEIGKKKKKKNIGFGLPQK